MIRVNLQRKQNVYMNYSSFLGMELIYMAGFAMPRCVFLLVLMVAILGCPISSMGYVSYSPLLSRSTKVTRTVSDVKLASISVRLRGINPCRLRRSHDLRMQASEAKSFCTLVIQVVRQDDEKGRTIDADELSELLMETGALSVIVEDADRGTEQELPIFNEPGLAERYWNICNITAFYPNGWDIPAVLEMVVKSMDLPVVPRYAVDEVRDQDWVKLVQQSWKPILIDHLLLRFPWHSKEDIDSVVPQDSEIHELMLEGGMAFGTGEHPTTRLCCRWLQQKLTVEDGQRVKVMDYGAGSGVGDETLEGGG